MTKITVLNNGFKIITEKRNFNNVSMGVFVKVGLFNETDEMNGISHFLEHMAFKGTKTKTAQELVDSIEKLGGNCNAFTSTTHTAYLVNLLPEHWKAGVDFLSDIIKNSTFPEEEIERERNVILQEIAMYEDNISSVSWNEIISNAFKGQALGRKVIGTEENVKRFTRNDLIKYITDGYVANKMTFSICGNVKHEEVVKYVKAAFSNLNTEFKLQEFSSKYKSPKKRKEVETKFDQAHVCLTVPGRKMFERSNYVHSIFNNILDGGMSTRLFQEVRERNGLGYATSTIAESEPNTGIYGVWAAVDKEDIEKTVEVLEAAFKSMMQNIGDDEFEKAKNITLYNLTSKEDDCYSVMDANAVCGIFDKKRKSLKTKKAIINKITKQDVIEYAKSLCDKEMDIVIVKPKVEERI